MDTRKTTPGSRLLEKYAVRVGGGQNHRMNLADGILVKDNHLTALHSCGLSTREVIAKARRSLSSRTGLPLPSRGARQTQIEIEVKTVPEAVEAAEAGADIIMLDNMDLEDMHKAVEAIRGRALIEASGGITLDRVRAVAEAGVDFISVGALTHSAKALDITLYLDQTCQ